MDFEAKWPKGKVSIKVGQRASYQPVWGVTPRVRVMFLVRISNELQIAMFNRQLSDLIGKYSAINLMRDLMDD